MHFNTCFTNSNLWCCSYCLMINLHLFCSFSLISISNSLFTIMFGIIIELISFNDHFLFFWIFQVSFGIALNVDYYFDLVIVLNFDLNYWLIKMVLLLDDYIFDLPIYLPLYKDLQSIPFYGWMHFWHLLYFVADYYCFLAFLKSFSKSN